MDHVYKIGSPVGMLTLSSDGTNLTGLWIAGQKYFCSTLGKNCKKAEKTQLLPVFAKAEKWLNEYFNGKAPETDFPLLPYGSGFRKAVWDILCKIPYGQTLTYGDIAKQIAKQTGRQSMSAQAVGGAVGHNPISIIIPCHRVVGTDGSMTGYAGGLSVKKKLLELEKADTGKLYIPKKGTAL